MPPGNTWYGNLDFRLVHDLEAGRKLMADAGYGPGKPLRTRVGISTSGSGQMQPLPMNEFLQQNLRKIYLEVDFEAYDWSALIDVWHGGAKGGNARRVSAINFNYGSFDPYNAVIRLLKSSLAAPAGLNRCCFGDPELDRMFTGVYQTFGPARQDALLRTIHERVVDQALLLFAAHDLNPRGLSPRGLSPKVHGFVEAQNWSQDLTPTSIS